jgi:hypothetical protein
MNVTQITQALLDYCRQQDWSGYDPYDALNSSLFGYAVPVPRPP